MQACLSIHPGSSSSKAFGFAACEKWDVECGMRKIKLNKKESQ
jgi:hypothetical protein